MDILDLIYQAQLHRQVYIAILNSMLRTPASKQYLAKQIDISTQTLSYICHPEANQAYSSRFASPKIIEKIAKALPFDDDEQRQSLRNHMYLARKKASQIVDVLSSELPPHPIADMLEELRTAHQVANDSPDPQRAKSCYLAVRDGSKMLLRHKVLYTYPLKVIEICMLLHDVQCVLNHAEDALYWAKAARAIIASLDRSDYRDKELFARFHIQVFRAEAVAYNNLGLFKEAYDCCRQAEASEAVKYQIDHGQIHLKRDEIKALSGRPRFVLSEVEGLADQAKKICDQRSSEFDPLYVLLVNNCLGEAYLKYSNVKKAGKLLVPQLKRLEEIPHLGHLHRTMFLRTFARYRFKEGDLTEWKDFITQALACALSAGLTHQINEIRHEYGNTIQSLLQELNGLL